MAETRTSGGLFSSGGGVIEGALKPIPASGTATLLDGGRTWDDLIADYDVVRFEFVTVFGGFDHYSDVTVRTSDMSLNGRVRPLDGDGTNFAAQIVLDNAFTTGDATGSFTGWTGQQVRVVGISK